MTINRPIVIIGIAAVIAAAIPIIFLHHRRPSIEYHLFRSGNGWGYDIVDDGKLVIRQEFIPVIAAKKQFPTSQEAEQAAELVVYKLKNNKFPTLSKAEVEQICGDNHLQTPQQGMHE